MTRIIASALIATAAFAGAANAMTNSNLHDARIYAPNADFSQLSTAEANKVKSIIIGGGTESEKRAAVRLIVQ